MRITCADGSGDFAVKIERVAAWVAATRDVVVFTGAGISTDSGIPDFRGPDGVWTRRDAGLPPPRWKVAPGAVAPNAGHMALVALQAMGRLRFLISQNVDGLHRASGIAPERLAELHGNGGRMKCLDCDRRFDKAALGWDEGRWGKGYRTSRPVAGQPCCPCGGRIISSVVNFGDPMPAREMALAAEHSRRAEVFLVAGSSLQVSPANDFPVIARDAGAKLVIVNHGETPLDDLAHLRFFEGTSEVLAAIVEGVEARAG